MVLKKERIRFYLQELERIMTRLETFEKIAVGDLSDLAIRWQVERGLIAAAQIVFDVADHILASDFGVYPEKYEESIEQLASLKVTRSETREGLETLGGFRNVLVHEYVMIETRKLHEAFLRFLPGFRSFTADILAYLDRAP